MCPRIGTTEALDAYRMRDEPFVRDAWQGWTVGWRAGGGPAHFELTGRSMPEDLVPCRVGPVRRSLGEDEVLKMIEAALLGRSGRKETIHGFARVAAGLMASEEIQIPGEPEAEPPRSWVSRIRERRARRRSPPVQVSPGFLDPVPDSGPDLSRAGQRERGQDGYRERDQVGYWERASRALHGFTWARRYGRVWGCGRTLPRGRGHGRGGAAGPWRRWRARRRQTSGTTHRWPGWT